MDEWVRGLGALLRVDVRHVEAVPAGGVDALHGCGAGDVALCFDGRTAQLGGVMLDLDGHAREAFSPRGCPAELEPLAGVVRAALRDAASLGAARVARIVVHAGGGRDDVVAYVGAAPVAAPGRAPWLLEDAGGSHCRDLVVWHPDFVLWQAAHAAAPEADCAARVTPLAAAPAAAWKFPMTPIGGTHVKFGAAHAAAAAGWAGCPAGVDHARGEVSRSPDTAHKRLRLDLPGAPRCDKRPLAVPDDYRHHLAAATVLRKRPRLVSAADPRQPALRDITQAAASPARKRPLGPSEAWPEFQSPSPAKRAALTSF